MSIMFAIGKPRGAGRLRWTSADPRAAPLIESNLLDHAADRAAALDAMETAYAIATTRPAADVAVPLYPRASVLEDRPRRERKILKLTDSGYHPCGTVPMGSPDDPAAACGAHERVRGVERLRVADASLMPTIPATNIHLSTLMIGERMAELIDDE